MSVFIAPNFISLKIAMNPESISKTDYRKRK